MTIYKATIWTPDGKIELNVDSRKGHSMQIDGNVLVIKYNNDKIKYANMPFIVHVIYISEK